MNRVLRTKSGNESNFKDKVPSLKPLYIISAIFSVLAMVAFCWQREFYPFRGNYVADTNLLGTFGDFLGGILGAVFSLVSCVLLVKTLTLQQAESRANYKELELQRFNNIFFELLRLYQKDIAELSSSCIEHRSVNISESKYINNDYFFVEKMEFQKRFNCDSSVPIQDIAEEARKAYTEFYLSNSSVAHCYRSLYRIYCIIEDASIEEYDKKEYLKILRAQLTESELFFLRYNSISFYGQKFKKYLNKYNVLKHLPICDLIEFKKYWMGWSELERESINTIFSVITGAIRRLLAHRPTRHSIICLDSRKYSIDIECKQFYEITINVKIDTAIPRCDRELAALDCMEASQISSLLSDYLLEIFYCRTFGMANHFCDLRISTKFKTIDEIEYISVSIMNIKKEPLNLFVKQSPLYVDLAQCKR